MSSFKLDSAGYKLQERGKAVSLLYIVCGFAAVASVFIPTGQSVNASYGNLHFVVPALLVCAAIGLWGSVRRQRKRWASYELVIDEDTITRTQNNVPTITITKDEIQYMVESAKGVIVIKSLINNWMIMIPAGIANREDLISILAGLGEIQHPD
jgi:predicted membrane-bound mannosyltransferase